MELTPPPTVLSAYELRKGDVVVGKGEVTMAWTVGRSVVVEFDWRAAVVMPGSDNLSVWRDEG